MLSILRIAAGFLFMPNGTLKLFNYPAPPHPMPLGRDGDSIFHGVRTAWFLAHS
jgi:hypothetical protein